MFRDAGVKRLREVGEYVGEYVSGFRRAVFTSAVISLMCTSADEHCDWSAVVDPLLNIRGFEADVVGPALNLAISLSCRSICGRIGLLAVIAGKLAACCVEELVGAGTLSDSEPDDAVITGGAGGANGFSLSNQFKC